jgi:anti-sigma factor RsiW
MSQLDCKKVLELMTAYADGEVDAVQRDTITRHLDQCRTCSLELANLNSLKSAMRADALLFNAPGALVKRVNSLIDKAADPAGKPARAAPRLKWLPMAAAAGFVVAAGVAAYVLFVPSAQRRMEKLAVAEHQRAVQSEHLVDFATSDPQKMIGWFTSNSKLTPPMVPYRLAPGFVLVGGRLDSLGDRPVAALVFRNGTNMADVFQWPSNDLPGAINSDNIGGSNVSAWNNGTMSFCAVTDGGPGSSAAIPEMFTIDSCSPH